MARHVDAEMLEKAVVRPSMFDINKDDVLALIAEQPTADVVEVVRCKDCAVPHNRWTGCPKLNGLVTPPDFYCSYGERRKGNG